MHEGLVEYCNCLFRVSLKHTTFIVCKILAVYNIALIFTKSENKVDIKLLSSPVQVFPLSSDAEFTDQLS